MSRRREDIEEQVGTVVATLRAGVERHPSARRIATYHGGELPAPEMEQVRDHLAMCPECAELVLDFSGFREQPTTSVAERWETRKEAVWGVLRSQLGKPSEPAAKPRPASPDTVPRREPAGALPRWLPLAAAALLALGAGLGSWLTPRWQDDGGSAAGDLLQPQVVVPSHDLFPPSFRRGDETPQVLEVPPEAQFFILQLHLAETGSHADYQLRILDAESGEVWSGTGLSRTPGGAFRIALPRRFLPAGSYRLDLSGVEGPTARRLARYELAVEYL